MSGCFIKCNKFNKYFIYILLTTFFTFFNISLIGFNHNDSFKKVSLYEFLYNRLESKKDFEKFHLSKFKIIELFWNFVGIFIFSLFSNLYELKISGKNIKDFFKIRDNYLLEQRKLSFINVEKRPDKSANILQKFKDYLVHNSSIFLYIIFSIFWVAKDILMIMFNSFLKDLDYWILEILIVTIIYSKIFSVQIYKHQKLAIIINLTPCILKTINIILSFFINEEILYKTYPWWIPVGFICYLFLIAINAFINCTIKSFIDLKYTTISQLLIFYSLVGIVICSLTFTISTFAPCGEINNKNIIDNKICKVENDKYTYFDNIIIYFNSFNNEESSGKFIRIIIIILDALTFFLKEYFYILVIELIDPVSVTVAQPLYFMLKKIVLIINNLIIKSKFFEDTSNSKPARFFLDISGDFICLIGFFIYLEIIELNICNLNHDLRKNISDRGISNSFAQIEMKTTFPIEMEEEEADGDNNSKTS